MMMQTFTIGKAAKAAGVGVETIRYYERQGLIRQPDMPDSGYREYPESVVSQIRFIKQNQALGFTLKEIKAVLCLLDGSGMTCSHAGNLLEDKISEIDTKITELKTLKALLIRLKGMTGGCCGQSAMEIIAGHLSEMSSDGNHS